MVRIQPTFSLFRKWFCMEDFSTQFSHNGLPPHHLSYRFVYFKIRTSESASFPPSFPKCYHAFPSSFPLLGLKRSIPTHYLLPSQLSPTLVSSFSVTFFYFDSCSLSSLMCTLFLLPATRLYCRIILTLCFFLLKILIHHEF